MRRGARAMCKGHEKRCKGLRIFQNFKVPCTSSCGPCTKLYCLSLVWPLHTSEALAPLLVALAHIQVALAPISIYRICGPCTWPLHLFSWPLHMPLHLENAPFQPSKRYLEPEGQGRGTIRKVPCPLSVKAYFVEFYGCVEGF